MPAKVQPFSQPRKTLYVILLFFAVISIHQRTLFAALESIKTEPKAILSTKVEHAPNTPKNGILISRRPKLEEIH